MELNSKKRTLICIGLGIFLLSLSIFIWLFHKNTHAGWVEVPASYTYNQCDRHFSNDKKKGKYEYRCDGTIQYTYEGKQYEHPTYYKGKRQPSNSTANVLVNPDDPGQMTEKKKFYILAIILGIMGLVCVGLPTYALITRQVGDD